MRQLPVLVTVLAGLTLLFGAALPSLAAAEESVPAHEVVEGRLVALLSSVRFEPGARDQAPSLSVVLESGSEMVSVTLDPEAEIVMADGTPVPAGELPAGALVQAQGRWLSATAFVAHRLVVLDSPAP